MLYVFANILNDPLCLSVEYGFAWLEKSYRVYFQKDDFIACVPLIIKKKDIQRASRLKFCLQKIVAIQL